MNHKLSDDIDLLNLMMADMSAQKPIYKPGPYWGHKARAAFRAIKKLGINDFRSHKGLGISESYSDVLNLDPTIRWRTSGRLSRLLLSVLADYSPIRRRIINQFTQNIMEKQYELSIYKNFYINHKYKEWLYDITSNYVLPESVVGGAEDLVNINGQSFSSFYLESIARIYNYSSRIDFTKIDSLFEIGGGFGCNAHLLMHMFPNIKKYLYLDIPPNLYVGTQYLKYFFQSAVVDYKETTKKKNIEFKNDQEREILTIAPWQIEMVNVSVDGVWNSHSFVEMPLSTVENYAKYIKTFLKKEPSSFLCILTYDRFDPSTTLNPNTILEVFKQFLDIEEISPRINLAELEKKNSYYYFGKLADTD